MVRRTCSAYKLLHTYEEFGILRGSDDNLIRSCIW